MSVPHDLRNSSSPEPDTDCLGQIRTDLGTHPGRSPATPRAYPQGGSGHPESDPWECQTVTLQIRLPSAIKHRFQDWCDDQGCTMSAVLYGWILSRTIIGVMPKTKAPR